MNKIFKILISLLSIGTVSNAQQTFNITTSFGVDVANNIIETDSGYYSAVTSGQPVLPRHSILCFYDTLGNLKWNKVYGDSLEYFNDYSLYQDSIGNFTMGAGYYSARNHKDGMSLRKVTINGDSLWFHSYGPDTSKNYFGAWVLETKKSEYLIPNCKSDTADGNIYALKTDSAGNFQWGYELLGNKYDQAYDAAEGLNGDFLIVGYTRSFGNGNSSYRDAIVVCIDSTGNYKWKKTFGGNMTNEVMFRVTRTQHYDFLVSGEQYIVGQFGTAGITKIDLIGNLIWQKYFNTISNISEFYGIHELPNKNIVAVGSDRDTTTHKDQGWIVLLDSVGNIIKERRFTVGNDHCIFNDVKPTKDGGFIIAGYVFGGPNGEDGWLVKLDSNLCDVAGCASSTAVHEITNYATFGNVIAYPNPCTNDLFIKADFGTTIFSATVFDITGKEITTANYPNRELLQIATNNLSPGIYFVKLKTESGEKFIRFLKQ